MDSKEIHNIVKKSLEENETIAGAVHDISFALSTINNEAIRRECAEKAVIFVDNNYNAFGEWDRVAFDDLRSAIISAEPEQDDGKAERLPGYACPACGAHEIEANTPHTVYECGSYEYDQRPGTFCQGEACSAEVKRRLEEAKE